jgi:hypothetical protein
MRAGSSKSVSTTTSSDGYETSINIVSEGVSIGCSIGSPIVVASSSESGASMSTVQMREYPASDPYYVHPPLRTPNRACKSLDSMYNQPYKPRHSNPIVQLIIPERMSVPRGLDVLEFTVLSNASKVCLESDNGPSMSFDEQVETDPDVLEWIDAQKKEKVSYEATRKFQESWAAKLFWASCVKGNNGLFDYVKCNICSMFEVRDKILKPKWDTLKKHGGNRKAKKDLPAKGVKKGQWYIATDCKHLINEQRYNTECQVLFLFLFLIIYQLLQACNGTNFC